jgi:phosphoribosylglycinamide formyltransferase-1
MAHKFNLAIFASGGGSNAKKIIEYFKGHLIINISCIITNNPKAGVIMIAEENQIPVEILARESLKDEYLSRKALDQYDITHIVLAGYLLKIPNHLIRYFSEKIINIHPSLLPKYGGKGMYGHHVHEAVKANNETESGMTIHLVDEIYDNGKIIFQAKVNLDSFDTPDDIASKVLALEHKHYSKVIEDWVLGNKQG